MNYHYVPVASLFSGKENAFFMEGVYSYGTRPE